MKVTHWKVKVNQQTNECQRPTDTTTNSVLQRTAFWRSARIKVQADVRFECFIHDVC